LFIAFGTMRRLTQKNAGNVTNSFDDDDVDSLSSRVDVATFAIASNFLCALSN